MLKLHLHTILFSSFQIEPAENLCFEEHPWEPYFASVQSIYMNSSLREGRAFNYVDGVSGRNWIFEMNYETCNLFSIFLKKVRLLGNNINHILHWHEIMEKHVDEIRQALQLKQKFLEVGDRKLEQIKEDFLKSQKKKRRNLELVFIGVHIRY